MGSPDNELITRLQSELEHAKLILKACDRENQHLKPENQRLWEAVRAMCADCPWGEPREDCKGTDCPLYEIKPNISVPSCRWCDNRGDIRFPTKADEHLCADCVRKAYQEVLAEAARENE